jgi:hypothetical protein
VHVLPAVAATGGGAASESAPESGSPGAASS